jgi:hypothetical protein
MSASTPESSSIPSRRKRTATERVTENGDPLVAKKKVREAARKAPGPNVRVHEATQQVPASNATANTNATAVTAKKNQVLAYITVYCDIINY